MRILVIAGACLWGLVAFLELTDAGVGCFSQVFLVLGGGTIALAWIGVSIAQPQVFDTPRVCLRWCAVPAIGLLAAVLATTNVGLMVRVWLSEAELRDFAEQVIADPDHSKTVPRRVGLLTVDRVWADERQIRIYTAPSGFLDCAGVMYCPDGDEPRSPGRHAHLFGPWWWYWERF